MQDVKRVNLKLAPSILLNNNPTPRIRIKSQVVDGILLASPQEQILINLSVRTSQAAVKLPIRESPRIHEPYGVGTDLVKQASHGLCAGEGNLAGSYSAGGEEVGSFPFESVEGKELEKFVEAFHGWFVEGRGCFGRGDCGVEVLDD